MKFWFQWYNFGPKLAFLFLEKFEFKRDNLYSIQLQYYLGFFFLKKNYEKIKITRGMLIGMGKDLKIF